MNTGEDRIETAAVLGAGVIGSGWTALFLAAGLEVHVYDPDAEAETKVRNHVSHAWDALSRLEMTSRGDRSRIVFHGSPEAAVAEAGFVQENVPERIGIKSEMFSRIEPHLKPGAVTASSASGLMLSEMQKGWNDPSGFILGHPFNPPHLIPLVELVANGRTGDGVLERAERFYADVGKVTIRIRREVPAHVSNRLQAALWREAIHLVASGVASVEDIDKAVWAGPGLRWAAMGPNMLFHLGAGEGGMEEFCRRYRDSFHCWWDDLGNARLTDEIAQQLSEGIKDAAGSRSVETLSARRDEMVVGMLSALSKLRDRNA